MGGVAAVLLAASLLRLLFVFLGSYIDRLNALGSSYIECSSGSISATLCAAETYISPLIGFKYTDIDYQVFSDAASHIYNGRSPYECGTYRYPPIIALLLTSNSLVHSDYCGKIIFCFFDVVALYLMYVIIKMETESSRSRNNTNDDDQKGAIFYAWIYALNPLSVVICSRGSADSLSNSLVLLLVLQLLQLKRCKSRSNIASTSAYAGITYASTVYLRIYPAIFLPCIAAYLYRIHMAKRKRKMISHNNDVGSAEGSRCDECDDDGKTTATDYNLLVLIDLFVAFFLPFAVFLIALVGLSLYVYGNAYLQNAVVYHFFRTDFKHNFSIHFYSNYLGLAASGSSGGSSDVVTYASRGMLLLLPHIVSLFAVYRFAGDRLVFCMFLQTIIFVAFNKVVTAQYFTWYATLLPLVAALDVDMDRLLRDGERFWSLIIVAVMYILSVLLWLYTAYRLEMEGRSVFVHVWLSSLLFNIVNSFFIVQIVKTAYK